MTREAKIGMLTGLAVIVLIGVLLSEYLGGSAAPGGPAGGGIATGRMAVLPVGASYRQQVLDPVLVPGMTRNDAQADPVAPIVTTLGDLPAAYATDPQSPPTAPAAGPAVAAPVMPEPAGRAPIDLALNSAPPLLTVPDPALPPPRPAAPSGQPYVIKPGDTLTKIAKASYNSAKTSDLQRIISANPTVLKDQTTPLIAGRKLLIPPLPTAPVQARGTALQPAVPTTVYVPLPGPLKSVAPKASTVRKPTLYMVQSGDTLEKIAHKIAPQHTPAMVQKIMADNGIKDPHALKSGTTLKLPA